MKKSFKIRSAATFDVTDYGTDTYQEVEWDAASSCQCGNLECKHVGTVAEFTQAFQDVDGGEEFDALRKMLCPDCGETGPFDIRGRAWFRVLSDGRAVVRQTDGFRFNSDDLCNCVPCARNGICGDYTVSDFEEAWENAQSCHE